LLEAIFDLGREETVKRVQAGTLSQSALAAHDYVFDIFPDASMFAGRAQINRET
jgi:hypothetical protein